MLCLSDSGAIAPRIIKHERLSYAFCSMKQLRALLLSPRWDASPSQGTQHEATRSTTTPPGWDASPSQGTQHEATRSTATPPGWDASPSQGTQHEATRSTATPPGWDASPSQWLPLNPMPVSDLASKIPFSPFNTENGKSIPLFDIKMILYL